MIAQVIPEHRPVILICFSVNLGRVRAICTCTVVDFYSMFQNYTMNCWVYYCVISRHVLDNFCVFLKFLRNNNNKVAWNLFLKIWTGSHNCHLVHIYYIFLSPRKDTRLIYGTKARKQEIMEPPTGCHDIVNGCLYHDIIIYQHQ